MTATDTDTITCAVCGKTVPLRRSRLFWASSTGETFRTCPQGDRPHCFTRGHHSREQHKAQCRGGLWP